MAMSANFVHLKEEMTKSKLRAQLEQDAVLDMVSTPPTSNEKTQLVFNMSDTGSFITTQI